MRGGVLLYTARSFCKSTPKMRPKTAARLMYTYHMMVYTANEDD